MTVGDIIKKYLVEEGYDGLCHPPTECGCGIDNLIGPCEGAQSDCQPAYRILDPEGDRYFVCGFDHRPTEEEIRAYWDARTREKGK